VAYSLLAGCYASLAMTVLIGEVGLSLFESMEMKKQSFIALPENYLTLYFVVSVQAHRFSQYVIFTRLFMYRDEEANNTYRSRDEFGERDKNLSRLRRTMGGI